MRDMWAGFRDLWIFWSCLKRWGACPCTCRAGQRLHLGFSRKDVLEKPQRTFWPTSHFSNYISIVWSSQNTPLNSQPAFPFCRQLPAHTLPGHVISLLEGNPRQLCSWASLQFYSQAARQAASVSCYPPGWEASSWTQGSVLRELWTASRGRQEADSESPSQLGGVCPHTTLGIYHYRAPTTAHPRPQSLRAGAGADRGPRSAQEKKAASGSLLLALWSALRQTAGRQQLLHRASKGETDFYSEKLKAAILGRNFS